MTETSLDRADMESDVVIVGAGGAGGAAAITAHDAGASVIIMEKMPKPGGNTRFSSASWFCPPPGTEAEAVKHAEALCLGNTDRETIQGYVEEASKTKTWIEALGAETKLTRFLQVRYPQITHPSWPNFPGAKSQVNYRLSYELDFEAFGLKLWELLSSHLERRGIKITCSTPAKELVTNEKGEVIGVIAERAGQRISVRAKRAVVLTCGGFEFNEAMKEEYLPFKPIYGVGNPGNTGDGIIMAEKVGAALWHMTLHVGGFGFKAPEYDAPFHAGQGFVFPGFIYVNKDGKRFTNELGRETHFQWQALMFFDSKKPGYPTIPFYSVFDQENIRRGPLSVSTSERTGNYKWSLDNSAEIAKGWIKRGKTIRELAKQISVDEATLENTIAKYNEYCKTGVDHDFHRARETMEPIKSPPYYAMELWPYMPNTMGGPRRDGKGRVLSTSGQPIPRLYSAGELGSLWGFLYYGGGNVGEVLATGRIAGRNATAEKPWC
ncbi:MAG: FAD-dependent oxidoreductase [Chloroflexi bacterium]|nr:FAD-dependent oxidoreductase [Chloroflexota bacterium]